MHMTARVLAPPEGSTPTIPWPSVPFTGLRLESALVTWGGAAAPGLNPSDGVFDFSRLDAWLTKIQQEASQSPTGSYDAMYTFKVTPTWASSNPTDTDCAKKENPGGCDPPNDLSPDGTGTDQHWKDFVNAVATHTHDNFPGVIRYWEIWNEPNVRKSWKGTIPQLITMAKDATTIIKSIDPNAQITTPTPVFQGNQAPWQWMQQYLPKAIAAGASPDIVTFHGYVFNTRVEQVASFAEGLAGVANSVGLSSKPIWDTEAGFDPTMVPDEDDQAAFVARSYLVQWSKGVSRFYWYLWDAQGRLGWMWDVSTMTIRKPGVAYGEVYRWMVGNNMSAPCSANGSVWTCGFTRQGSSYQAQAVWDASQSCASGSCTTSSFTPDSIYIHFKDLDGNATSLTPGAPIQIGAKPVLLENQ